jgi:hypothetical protein
MKQIWKYELPKESNTISMPKNAEVLSVEPQNNKVCIWAKVDPSKYLENRTFVIFGTGHNIDNDINLHFIGTVLLFDGSIVLHVFEKV